MFTPKNTENLTAPWIAQFWYSPSGAGKTTAAATFPRPLFLVPQNENSTTTLMGQKKDYIDITSMDGPFNKDAGNGGMIKTLEAIHQWYKRDPTNFPWDTIIIESLSHYQEMAMPDLETRSKGQQLWGLWANHLRWMHNTLRSMEVYTIYTSLADTKGGEEGSVQVGAPMLSGKMGSFKLPAACDILAYFEVVGGKSPIYRTHLQKHKCYEARCRIPGMPKEFENLTFEKMEPFLTSAANKKAVDNKAVTSVPKKTQLAAGAKTK